MKKTIGIVAILLCATLAQALPQENEPARSASSPKMPRSKMSRLVDRLNTTEQQKEAIAAIRKRTIDDNAEFLETMERTLAELRAARVNDESKIPQIKQTMKEQREQLKKIQEDELQTIMDVLTREQKGQFEELRAARERRDAAKSRE